MLDIKSVSPELIEKFWSHVRKTDGCWLWEGAQANDYGYIVVNRRPFHAHRFSYLLRNGCLPSKSFVLKHVCSNRLCVRPDHLRLGTKNEHGTASKVPPIDRFLSKVEKTDTCWLWRGSVDECGYGSFKWSGRQNVKAHRFSYEHFVGPIPPGLTLDHLCRVRNCVRPDHLEPVSLKENILRGESPAAQQARQTHCKRGHELTEENTYTSDGGRHCRACQIERREGSK